MEAVLCMSVRLVVLVHVHRLGHTRRKGGIETPRIHGICVPSERSQPLGQVLGRLGLTIVALSTGATCVVAGALSPSSFTFWSSALRKAASVVRLAGGHLPAWACL